MAAMKERAGKRPAEAAAERETEESKRFRSAMDEMADELVCPITFELPIDPVMAEDGKVYERSAIETWLQGKATSPSTNLPMGRQLKEVRIVRNIIEKLVRSGGITGDKAESWQERIQDVEYVAQLRQRAEDGDADAMVNLGSVYCKGDKGVHKDLAESYRWYQRAADFGDAAGMHGAGLCFLVGIQGVVPVNKTYGVSLVSRAAAAGHCAAAVLLAGCHEKGLHSLPKNAAMAKDIRRKCACSCTKKAYGCVSLRELLSE